MQVDYAVEARGLETVAACTLKTLIWSTKSLVIIEIATQPVGEDGNNVERAPKTRRIEEEDVVAA
jgi:hypothetical protein